MVDIKCVKATFDFMLSECRLDLKHKSWKHFKVEVYLFTFRIATEYCFKVKFVHFNFGFDFSDNLLNFLVFFAFARGNYLAFSFNTFIWFQSNAIFHEMVLKSLELNMTKFACI